MFVTTAAVVLNVHIFADSPQKPTRKQSTSKSAKTTAVKSEPEPSFDDTLTKLPVPFVGNTVEWVLKNCTIRPKGEFETTAEYNGRLRAFQSEMYAFVPDERETFAYDADTETFSAEIYPGITDVHSKIGWYFRPFDIHRKKLSETTYVGSNAYGAKALVTKSKWKLTQIVVDETSDILHYSFEPIKLSFKVPRDHARELKSKLQVIFVCTTRSEQFPPDPLSDVADAAGYDISNPTIDSPTERWTYYVTLRADLRQIWIFDPSTGAVLGRFTPEGLQVDAPIPLIR